MIRNLTLIPYNCGFGAQLHGCADGPKVLKERGLAENLNKRGIPTEWADFRYSRINIEDYTQVQEFAALPLVADYCAILRNQVIEAVNNGKFPVTIGGDHSMAIGTWGAIAENRTIGLIWIDAHLDSHTPQTTPSGAYHGMPAACLLGIGEPDLIKDGVIIKPENLCFIGTHSYENEECQLLQSLGVRIFNMNEIDRRGMKAVIADALAIATKNTDGFGITIDLDAFDPQVAPGVGSPEQGGLFREDTFAALHGLGNHPDLLAVEIAEYNPHLGKDNKTTTLITDLLTEVFKGESGI